MLENNKIRYLLGALKYYFFSSYFSDTKVLFRSACLINTPIKNISKNHYLNFQKLRVDVLYKIKNNNLTQPKIFDLFLLKPFLFTVYFQQLMSFWEKVKEKEILIMDSYSELTDQLFLNGKNVFLAHFNDVKSSYASKGITCEGLLKEDEIYNYYKLFFDELFFVNPNLTVYFFTYPIIKESREKYIRRSKLIKDAIKLLSTEYNIVFFDLDKLDYYLREDDEIFPYHYNSEFYIQVSKILEGLISAHK